MQNDAHPTVALTVGSCGTNVLQSENEALPFFHIAILTCLNMQQQPLFPRNTVNMDSWRAKILFTSSEAPKSSKQEIFPPAVHA